MMHHQPIMRPTIDLPGHLLVNTKKLAAERHPPLNRRLEVSLRAYLGEERLRRSEEPAPLPVLTKPSPLPGVDLDDTSRLWERVVACPPRLRYCSMRCKVGVKEMPRMRSNGSEIPTLEDDGLLTPKVGDWAEEKYRLVRAYAHVFTTSMRGKWDELAYLDLFAGSGRAAIRGTGRIVGASPMLALSLEHRFDRYVFCEADAAKIDVLETRVLRDFPQVDARFVRGNVNHNAPAILAELPEPRRGHRVLAFCFVDPYSLGNLRFATITSLAERYMDFLVLIPSGYDATRNEGLYLSEDKRTVDDFLGNPRWRDAWANARARGESFDRFLTDAFGESMKELGYIYKGIESTHLVKSTEKRLRLYRLVLFSRHELGDKFWREVRKYTIPQQSLLFS